MQHILHQFFPTGLMYSVNLVSFATWTYSLNNYFWRVLHAGHCLRCCGGSGGWNRWNLASWSGRQTQGYDFDFRYWWVLWRRYHQVPKQNCVAYLCVYMCAGVCEPRSDSLPLSSALGQPSGSTQGPQKSHGLADRPLRMVAKCVHRGFTLSELHVLANTKSREDVLLKLLIT